MGSTERIIQYLDYKGITKYKFCKDLGFSNKFLDNSSNMGTDKACKILHHFPEINAEWFITGSGSMLKNDADNNENSIEKLDLRTEVFRLSTANSQLAETNELLRFKIGVLEERLSGSEYNRPDSTVYESVDEPQPELMKKTKKDDVKK
ncbi:hypothetical protein [Flavobacterium sp. MEB061]|uniref:hypothetical protein n=1 Tax=Flavobacterium sp. MEB061 TaxID=1587524 RepID=UPI000695F871|nr:hypothetical protein [Flavobacterium sp. MEB061]